MSDTSDQLLYVLSGRGELGWYSFKKAFSVLIQQKSERNHVNGEIDSSPKWALIDCIRTLEGMGHCDFDFDCDKAVYIAPPCLARLPRSGPATAVLTGARTPTLVESVIDQSKRHGAFVKNVHSSRTIFGAPTIIRIEAFSSEILQNIADDCGITYRHEPPAWQLANFAGSVADYVLTLNWVPASEPDWRQTGYNLETLGFTGLDSPGTSLHLSREDLYGRWIHALWKDGLRAAANLDWARYALASDQSRQIIAYDPAAQLFAVPVSVPLPKILCRALCLCSGQPPQRLFCPRLSIDIPRDRRRFDVFREVPHAIAELVSQKLSQNLKEARSRKGELIHG